MSVLVLLIEAMLTIINIPIRNSWQGEYIVCAEDVCFYWVFY